MAPQDLDAVLAEQIDYYRARAPEYDEWWQQTGRYHHGEDAVARFAAEAAEVERALTAFGPRGDVLDIAAGTGWWSRVLARTAGSLTCIDASPETIALNRARLAEEGLPEARYIQEDIFAWEPDRQYDVVAFSFWLSHIPAACFDGFWAKVRRALRPGGRVFFIDEVADDAARRTPPDPEDRQPRILKDGRRFTIIKIYYSPADLLARLSALGWRGDVRRTATHFLYGAVR